MANRAFHKAQAEALIAKHNKMLETGYNKDTLSRLIRLAQIHATLATVPDEVDE